jgi:hypothetical protein
MQGINKGNVLNAKDLQDLHIRPCSILSKRIPDVVPLVPEDNCLAILSLCMLSLQKETM